MWVCQKFGIDPGTYFLETNPDVQAVRDAAATVLYDEYRREQVEKHNTI